MLKGAVKIDNDICECRIIMGWENGNSYVRQICIEDEWINAEDFREWGIHEIYFDAEHVVFINHFRAIVLFALSARFRDIPSRRGLNRSEYRETSEWRERANLMKSLFTECQTCLNDSNLNVHHRTYERLGQEHPADLILLCQECHHLIHDRSNRPINDFYPRDEVTFATEDDVPF